MAKYRHHTIFTSIIAIGVTWSLPYFAFSATRSSGSGSISASRINRQSSFSRPFRRFGFFGVDGSDEQQIIIIQQQFAPTTEPTEPAKNGVYVQPRWVDGGYGVQVLEPGYWTDAKHAAQP